MTAERRSSIVALHGLARSPEEIDRMIVRVSRRTSSPDVRWVFPRAPERPVTILGGRRALAWYDVLACDRSRMDHAGIERATQAVCDAVRAERDGGSSERRVVLVGFSQGGALALHAGLRLRDEVEGIFALAAALPFPELVPAAGPGSPRVFLGHGRFDRRVPYALGYEAYRLLKAQRYDAEWHAYWCAHVLAPRALRDMLRWLERDLPQSPRLLTEGERTSQGGLAPA